MSNAFKCGMLLGRFQPCHNSHVKMVEKALEMCDHLVIVIGSANIERSYGNPFSAIERFFFLKESLNYLRGSLSFLFFDDDKSLSDNEFAFKLFEHVSGFVRDSKEIQSSVLDVIFTSESGIDKFYPSEISRHVTFVKFNRDERNDTSATKVRNMLEIGSEHELFNLKNSTSFWGDRCFSDDIIAKMSEIVKKTTNQKKADPELFEAVNNRLKVI